MKVIGITGGIGSGKSLVTNIMKDKYGAVVLNTDAIAKAQMEPDGVSYPEVVGFFGTGILTQSGTIDRNKLSAIAFQDKDKLLTLNAITHPKVLTEVKREIALHRELGDTPYLIIETALMIESGYDTVCDEVWYVYAPEERRRDWLKRERNFTDQKIDIIFDNQSKEEAFRSRFRVTIENVGDIPELEEQIQRILD